MRFLTLILVLPFSWYSVFSQKIPLSEFNLANSTSPAFVLIEESPTEVYVPENLKALTIHALNNFGANLSIELNPYYYLDTKNEGRTFFRYLGLEQDGKKYKQNPFSGIRSATTFSFAYADKEFEGFGGEKRNITSLGARTKILRFYRVKEVKTYYNKVSKILTNIIYPNAIKLELLNAKGNTQKQTEIKDKFFNSEEGSKMLKELELFRNPIKPFFQLDGAIGYSAVIQEEGTIPGTLNRFGTWLTSEVSIKLNKNGQNTKSNRYFNTLFVTRYIEDEFNLDSETLFYRDFGGKIEFEFEKFSFSYEYIKRNGSVESERSVGNIKFLINKDVSLTGGFGKDFSSDQNLITLFGIDWGLNFGQN
ncbi:MAG: hypothetical protein AAF717_15985 [Bacteroidota bacterium]